MHLHPETTGYGSELLPGAGKLCVPRRNIDPFTLSARSSFLPFDLVADTARDAALLRKIGKILSLLHPSTDPALRQIVCFHPEVHLQIHIKSYS